MQAALRSPDSGTVVPGVELLLHSGADITLLPQTAVAQLGVAVDVNKRNELMGFDGSSLHSGCPFREARDVRYLNDLKVPIWDLSERDWDSVAEVIRYHRMEDFVLGRFAGSLRVLLHSLWREKIRTFTHHRISDMVQWKGYGEVKLCQSVNLIRGLSGILNTLPHHRDLQFFILPAPIREANGWLAQILGDRQLPDVQSIRERLLEPLLIQIENDRDARVSEVARRRVGQGGEPQTQREISKHFGVTPDRIRTLLANVPTILSIRWPEGRYLLQAACTELSADPDRGIEQQLLRRILDVFFKPG